MKKASKFTLLNKHGSTERTKLATQVLVKNSSNKSSGNLIVKKKKAKLRLEYDCVQLESNF